MPHKRQAAVGSRTTALAKLSMHPANLSECLETFSEYTSGTHYRTGLTHVLAKTSPTQACEGPLQAPYERGAA